MLISENDILAFRSDKTQHFRLILRSEDEPSFIELVNKNSSNHDVRIFSKYKNLSYLDHLSVWGIESDSRDKIESFLSLVRSSYPVDENMGLIEDALQSEKYNEYCKRIGKANDVVNGGEDKDVQA